MKGIYIAVQTMAMIFMMTLLTLLPVVAAYKVVMWMFE